MTMQERMRHYLTVFVYIKKLSALFQSLSLLCLKSGEKLKNLMQGFKDGFFQGKNQWTSFIYQHSLDKFMHLRRQSLSFKLICTSAPRNTHKNKNIISFYVCIYMCVCVCIYTYIPMCPNFIQAQTRTLWAVQRHRSVHRWEVYPSSLPWGGSTHEHKSGQDQALPLPFIKQCCFLATIFCLDESRNLANHKQICRSRKRPS